MWIFLLVLSFSSQVRSANILGILPVPASSHNILFQRLILALAETGHNVTYMSHMPQKETVPNLTEIFLPINYADTLINMNLDLFSLRHMSSIDETFLMSDFGITVSENQLKSKPMQELLASTSSFDLVIAGYLSESIAAGVSHRYKAPIIAFTTMPPSLWCNYFVGNEAPTSYISSSLLGYPPKMTFIQRLHNFIVETIGTIHYHWVYLPRHQELLEKYFGQDVPPLSDLIGNTSLVLTNDHFSLTYPRPLAPNMIPIGGVHVNPPKKLPDDVQKYLDNANDGAILFSLGSALKSSLMPKKKIDIFLKTFSKLKEKVLWKFERDLPNKSNNVMISNWLPQSDILAHHNLKLFITHGGLLSTTESVDRGVPILGIPIFIDQPMNIKHSVNAGVGLALDYDGLSVDILLATIRELLDNPRYREAAKHRSMLLKDQPMAPLETAVWWVNYVIRNKGASHLRSSVQDLTWYQKHQLDVVVVLLIASLVLAWGTFKIMKRGLDNARYNIAQLKIKTVKKKKLR